MAQEGAPAAAAAPAVVAANPEVRKQWETGLKVGDLVDVCCNTSQDNARPGGYYVSRVTVASEMHVSVVVLYWNHSMAPALRTSIGIQPLGSKTQGRYTGPPQRLKAYLELPILPALSVIPLHPYHQLRRFSFDFDWQCCKCKKQKLAGQSQAYSCLPCNYDLCVDCFVADGGVDTHPLPIVAPPAKKFKIENYQKVVFTSDAVKPFECAVCLSVCRKPPNLACGHLFCHDCVSKIDSKLCPTCRQAFDPPQLQPIVAIQRFVECQKVHCANHAHGCKWMGDLGVDGKSLSDHVSACNYYAFSCPRCEQSITAVAALQHEKNCKVQANRQPPKRKRDA